MNVPLRHFRHQGIAHAVLRIEPEIRRGLRAAAQRDQQVLRDVALCESRLHGLRPIDVHVDGRFVAGLLDACVDETAHAAHCIEQTIRDRAILFELVADDLHVDRRGQAEVENLADDVRGQEREAHAGKRGVQHVAQFGDVLRGRPVLRCERDEDVRVFGTDRVR